MVRWRGDAAGVKAVFPTDAPHCWYLLSWWWPCFLGALPPSLWSKDNGSKESQVGILWSDGHERDGSHACAALQPGVWTTEHSSFRQTWIQACIVSWKSRARSAKPYASLLIRPLVMPYKMFMHKCTSPEIGHLYVSYTLAAVIFFWN